MNNKLTKLLTVGGVFFLAGTLAACGGGNNPGPTPDPDPEPEPQVEKVEINFWHTFGQTILDNLQPQLDEFVRLVKANDKVDVTINLVPNSNYPTINENINKGLTTGNIPTLAVVYPDHVADYIEAEGSDTGKFVVKLDNLITNSKYGLGKEKWLGDATNDSLSDFIESYVDVGRHYTHEGLYSFPYMKSTEAMLYNYDAVVKVLAHYKPEFQGAKNKIEEYMANLDWAEFMNLCRETWKYKDEINPALAIPAFYDSDSNLFISQLYQSNVGYSSIVKNSSGKNVGNIDFASGENRQKAETIVSNLRQNYQDHLFTTKGAFSTYGSDSFKNVESVFTIGSTGGSGYSFTSDFNMGVCKVPSLVGNNPTYVTQGPDLCIMRNPALSDTANEARTIYAWKLIKFLTNAKNNCQICLLGSEGYLPVRQSAYEDDLYLQFLDSGEFQAEIANVVTDVIAGKYFSTPCFPGSTALRTEVGGIITDALTKTTSITSIFDTAINNATLKIK